MPNIKPVDKAAESTNHSRDQALGVLDVDGLNVRKQPVLGALLVVTLARNADAEAVGNTLNALLPDLLVELRVDPDILSALRITPSAIEFLVKLFPHAPSLPPLPKLPFKLHLPKLPTGIGITHHGLPREILDLLDGLGSPLLERNAENPLVKVDGVFAGDNVGEGGAPGLLGLGGHF